MIEVITKIRLEKVQGWLGQSQEALSLENAEETEGYVSFSRPRLQRFINVFNLLHVRPEWRLDAYTWRTVTMGGGLVMARGREHPVLTPQELPDPTVPQHEKPWLNRQGHHAMMVLAGDGSPESFLQASLLSRELHELGSFFETVRWREHEVVDRAPALPEPSDFDPVAVTPLVRFPHPTDLTPRVRRNKEGVEVVFYTSRPTEPGQLFRFNDRYVPGRGYCYLSAQTLVVDVKKSRRALSEEQRQLQPQANETEVVVMG